MNIFVGFTSGFLSALKIIINFVEARGEKSHFSIKIMGIHKKRPQWQKYN
jgi:hypothetical protein